MSAFNDNDLRDPLAARFRASASVPWSPTRAHQLGRRRRVMQGAGALAMVAAVAVSVAALTGGGTSGPGGTSQVEAASSGVDTTAAVSSTTATTAAPTTVPTTVPAPAPETTTAPAPVQEAPVAAAAGSGSGDPRGADRLLAVGHRERCSRRARR